MWWFSLLLHAHLFWRLRQCSGLHLLPCHTPSLVWHVLALWPVSRQIVHRHAWVAAGLSAIARATVCDARCVAWAPLLAPPPLGGPSRALVNWASCGRPFGSRAGGSRMRPLVLRWSLNKVSATIHQVLVHYDAQIAFKQVS
jgi:hypothetical protein